jgi:glycosyltransferase involved in cell wall biosynthesis
MKILMANALYPPDRTGSSIFTRQLEKTLISKGHEVTVITSSVDPQFGDTPADSAVRLPVRRLKVGRLAWNYSIPIVLSLKNWKRVRHLLRSKQPDVVVCHGQIFDLTWITALAARREEIPCHVVIHTAIWHERLPHRLTLRAIEAVVIKPILRLARVSYVAVDKWTHDQTVNRLSKRSSIPVIPASVDVESMKHGNPVLARDKYKLGEDPLLLSLGHVISLRNRVALVRALPEILSSIPKLKLVIAGEVKDATFLEIADELGVRSSIICLGSVPHDDIRHLLSASLIEAHDLQGLGLGITTLEAMAAGVPVVAWASDDNYPGYSLRQHSGIAFIDDDRSATIAQACLDLIGNPSKRARAIEAQQKLVLEMFTTEAVASKYLHLLSQR